MMLVVEDLPAIVGETERVAEAACSIIPVATGPGCLYSINNSQRFSAFEFSRATRDWKSREFLSM